MPNVSVIIPTYNRANVLGRAVGSVLNQDYRDFEIIVVDDDSTDDTEGVVRGFDKAQIKYVRHEKNRGPAAARNTGIGHSKGKYIAFQDSDDEWFPQKLGRQVQILETACDSVGAVYTGFWRIKNDSRKYEPRKRGKREGDIHKELLKGNFLGTPTILIRKGCFESQGLFDEKLVHLEDWEAWLRISKHYEFRLIDEGLVKCFESSDSLSANLSTLIEAHEYILEKHAGKFAEYKCLEAEEQYWIGNLWCQIGNEERGRQYFKKAIRAMPLSPKYLGAWWLSFVSHEMYDRLVAVKRKLVDTRNSQGKS
jgi:glycosyltransferase involved in cell wall biosynthesis